MRGIDLAEGSGGIRYEKSSDLSKNSGKLKFILSDGFPDIGCILKAHESLKMGNHGLFLYSLILIALICPRLLRADSGTGDHKYC